MSSNPKISNLRFDVIVWNLPHAGFFGKMGEESEFVIGKHKDLLDSFFSNSSKLLKPKGEVHVTHQARGVYEKWNVEELTIWSGFRLKEAVPFDIHTFPGYRNRKGSGYNAGKPFLLRTTKTYKFVIREGLHNHIKPELSRDASQPRKRKPVVADSSCGQKSNKQGNPVMCKVNDRDVMAHCIRPKAPIVISSHSSSQGGEVNMLKPYVVTPDSHCAIGSGASRATYGCVDQRSPNLTLQRNWNVRSPLDHGFCEVRGLKPSIDWTGCYDTQHAFGGRSPHETIESLLRERGIKGIVFQVVNW